MFSKVTGKTETFFQRLRKEARGSLRILPGDWGKSGSGWLARSLRKRFARAVDGGKIHQSLWRRSRAARNAMQGLRSKERKEAAPS
jgi:hypothetical protein